MATAAPITGENLQPKQRVQVVDALRGLALVGMLLVHFQYYVHDESVWSGRVNWLVDNFAVNRFYPLFACLFGVGFALQFERWGERPGFVKMYLRRLFALMLIATVLVAATGYRVLESYAIWGLVLLAVRRWSNGALVVLVLLCAFSRPVVEFGVWQWERTHLTVEQSDANVRDDWRAGPEFHEAEDRLRDQRAFAQLAMLRLKFEFNYVRSWRFWIPSDPFVMILLGLFAVRMHIFVEPGLHRKLLMAVIIYGAIALGGSLLTVTFMPSESSHLRLTQAARYLMFAIFDERFHGLAYASLILLWSARNSASGRLVQWLSYPGRLSLTNYVVQVAVLETVFASSTPMMGLNRWTGLVGVVVVFATQVVFSRWWIARFRYGPLEWVWRSMTFARLEPLRRERTIAAAV
jgi:uncharacterized protein